MPAGTVSAIIAGIGAITAAIVGAAGASKEIEAQEKANKLYGEQYEKEQAIGQRQFGRQMRLQEDTLKQRKKEFDRRWQFENEKEQWGRSIDMVNNVRTMFDRDMGAKNRLMKIFQKG